ncbi:MULTISPECIES: DUF1240 domain-containing protein [Rahnella]|uniref:DUF1240 domain-containing protein n=1 Tax=Rahnella ecdela TaxID=2816250 RepID=A0ABS6LC16_9GAMM|nr:MULTISPECIES: DUF1240 domain-containing protein [Rahnella]MBU9844473.1 DUF1240 domain-containing protein [Rahnella ecdela]
MPIRNFIVILIFTLIFPVTLFFLYKFCLVDAMLLFRFSDAIYFNWRVFPILTTIPMAVYFEVLFVSCFFTKNKKASPALEKYILRMTAITVLMFFPVLLACPLVNLGFAFSSYHNCAVGGAFTGVFYVKDENQCYTLTGVKSWNKSHEKFNLEHKLGIDD